ncbi:MAG: hypothetical protein QGI34_05700 [Candidatus Latescibacteria bacterium]|nr:hypothetical protein [Candidatus Latescibacterota bacterium]
MNYLVGILRVELHQRQCRCAGRLPLGIQEGVVPDDGVVADGLHGTGAVEYNGDVGAVIGHVVPPLMSCR